MRWSGEIGKYTRPKARRGLLRALPRVVAVAFVAVLVGQVGTAMAESSAFTITSPANGSSINKATPTFSGSTYYVDKEIELLAEVQVEVYDAEGKLVQTLGPQAPLASEWSLGPAKALADGVYTAKAQQTDGGAPVGESEVTFSVDTAAPSPTITSPANGSSSSGESQLVTGTAGTAKVDVPEVTIHLESEELGRELPAVTVPVEKGTWSTTFGALSPGTYTTWAVQEDKAGNVGESDRVSFTLQAPAAVTTSTPDATPAGPRPSASFAWYPTEPMTGERVSLVSSSTDLTSPLTAFEWDLAGDGLFGATGLAVTTSFAKPGSHTVRLRVTDADGRSSIATANIQVSPPGLSLMQPFPIVRIAGAVTSFGVDLSLLTVQAPVGAQVSVTCGRRGCGARSQSRIARLSADRKGSTVVLTFRRFERALRAGVVLEIRVTKPGEIGKYTRFAIRRDKLPVRVDACVGPTNPEPIACPS